VLAMAAAAVVLSVATGPATAGKNPDKAALNRYLSEMSRPVGQSLLHADAVMSAITGWVRAGDPPFLQGIAHACRRLEAVRADSRLLHVSAPTPLRAKHQSVASTYSKVRARCGNARSTALAVYATGQRAARTDSETDRAAADKALHAARPRLQEFALTTLWPFIRSVHRWRAAALQYAAASGVAAPKWLKRLPH